MIEGLKVTVSTAELKGLCEQRATFHDERAGKYEASIEGMERDEIEGMEYTGGDPKKELRDRHKKHTAQAKELRFIAAHLRIGEDYLLGQDDLVKLGIVEIRFGF